MRRHVVLTARAAHREREDPGRKSLARARCQRLASGEVQDRRGWNAVEADDGPLQTTDEHVQLRSQERCVAASRERAECEVRQHLGGGSLRRLARPTQALAQNPRYLVEAPRML